ncbi:MAG: bifunctional N-acetylglucosamine-1-phosphate uridyltransferase/glucosamine-1-phosphate acetyltransferase [Acidimicrobiia bacterium]|nr:bifunctional N-acetylglucosamine-1-phosphate uridyltransferase/glucosamine-1-phosphate acetyltransferase [Acidimicrobiia bacterium]
MASGSLAAVVLAAGKSTRMRSARPKPLHLLCGRAMLLHILDAVSQLPVERSVVVVGHGAERVTKKLTEAGPPDLVIDFVEQQVQRGTGDAVMVALTAFPDDPSHDFDDDDVLVVPGDTPLLRATTLAQLVGAHRDAGAAATLLTARVDDPFGYGRVIRGKGDRVARIVEEADATPEEAAVSEVNTSIYCFRRSVLAPALRRTSPENASGEYYLTDIVEVLADAGYAVGTLVAEDPMECVGVNDRAQLAVAEAELRRRTNQRWLKLGITMIDPDRTYVDTTVDLATDVTLFPGVILQGATVVGERAEIGPGCRLVDCTVGADAVLSSTVAVDAEVGAGARVGPFASLPPGTSIPPGLVTGPFYTA